MSAENNKKDQSSVNGFILIPTFFTTIGVASIWRYVGPVAAIATGIVVVVIIAILFSMGIGVYRAIFTGCRLVPGVMWCPKTRRAFWTSTSLPKEDCKKEGFFVDAGLIERAEQGDYSWLRDLGLKEERISISLLVLHLAGIYRQATRFRWVRAVFGLVRVLIFAVLYLVVVNLIGAALLSLGLNVDAMAKLIAPSADMFGFAITELLAAIAVIGLFWRLWERRGLTELGIGFRQAWGGHLAMGAFVAAMLVAVIYIVGLLTGWVQFEGSQAATPVGIVGTLVLLLLMASAEELLFRGYILQSLERSSGAVVGVGVSSFLYALLHLGNPDADLLAFIGILAHGIFLCTLLLMTRSLWLPIGFHWAWNVFLGVVFGLPVSGYRFESILRSELVGSRWFYSPGGFGPEAGVLAILCLFIVGVGLLGWLLSKMPRAAA